MLRFCSLLILAAFLFFGCVTFGFGDYDKCGDKYYTAVNQVCEESVIKITCGNEVYNTSTQFCYGNTVFNKCGGLEYEFSTQDCCNNAIFNLATEKCEDGIIKMQCSDKDYNPATQICSNDVIKAKEEFVDNRDGKTYKYVTIGTQTWMAENLKHEVSNTKCYDDNPDNCETYGILYDWETAMRICPEGWHLPNDSEWNKLRDFVGVNYVGTKLKANSSLWISGKGTDEFGFTALPGGFYYDSYTYSQIGNQSGFWSASEGSSNGSAHYQYFKSDNGLLNLGGRYTNVAWSNVRCVRD